MEEKKVVLITGGAMGQGRAHAYKYAENGQSCQMSRRTCRISLQFAEV